MASTQIKDAKANELDQEAKAALLQKYREVRAKQNRSSEATGRTGTGLLLELVSSKKPHMTVTCKDRHEFDRLYDQVKRFRDKHDYDYVTITGSRKNLEFELFNDQLMEKL